MVERLVVPQEMKMFCHLRGREMLNCWQFLIHRAPFVSLMRWMVLGH